MRTVAFGVVLCLLIGGVSLCLHHPGAFAAANRTFFDTVLMSEDASFDGRWDVREVLRGGGCVQRASDRNFDNRVDRVDDFDPISGERVRSVVDLDLDGTADLLLPDRSGRVVFSEMAGAARRVTAPSSIAAAAGPDASPNAGASLLPMADPFAGDLTLRTSVTPRTPVVTCLATAGGLPVCCVEPASPFAEPSPLPPSVGAAPSLARRSPPASRGPSDLLAGDDPGARHRRDLPRRRRTGDARTGRGARARARHHRNPSCRCPIASSTTSTASSATCR